MTLKSAFRALSARLDLWTPGDPDALAESKNHYAPETTLRDTFGPR